jgi:tetratricopeptide (TPR) repeat protein
VLRASAQLWIAPLPDPQRPTIDATLTLEGLAHLLRRTDDIEEYIQRAQDEISAGRPRHALALAQAALAIDPKAGAAWRALGDARFRTEQWEGAAAALRASLLRQPEQPLVRGELADCLLRAGDREGAAAEARRTLAEAPDSSVAAIRFAALVLVDLNAEDARSALDRLLRINPRDPWALEAIKGLP